MISKSKLKKLKIDSEIIPSVLMITLSILAVLIVNSSFGYRYDNFFNHTYIFGKITWHTFVNEFLMAIFFFVAVLEIKREILEGSLSSIKKASFPIIGAVGGVVVPAFIYTIINKDTLFLKGIGVPISTDIAFAVGIFTLFKNKLNPKLKVFLLSLAVVDDLISILVIGVLYTSDIQIDYFLLAIIVVALLFSLNKFLNINKRSIYLLGGIALWYCIYKSGVHATMSGVLLGVIIPYENNKQGNSMLMELEHMISPIANNVILPLFAFANMGIVMKFGEEIQQGEYLVWSIIIALVICKPLGILMFTYIGDKLGITEKPKDVGWLCVFNTAIFAGIGFTMAIFVSEIAFNANDSIINLAKMSVVVSGIITICIIYVVTNYLYYTKTKIGELGCNHRNKEC